MAVRVNSMRIATVLLATLWLAACGTVDPGDMDETASGSTAITSSSGGHIALGVTKHWRSAHTACQYFSDSLAW
jgi:hypothetical protein